MTPIEIDVPDDGATPFFDFVVQLDGADYRLRWRYGDRAARWVLDVETAAGVPVVTGQVVTCGKDFLVRGAAGVKPPGILAALSRAASKEPPGLGETGYGRRVGLYYFPANG